ncbi:MAG: hypothetical protein COT25_03015 [Candidatus Kerfeldbacteria bacterium CG08_land_8_20_14_0_20_42_7]|uniref:Uncharacterized protein n=1 Tax=Candidatus Kerfeldbacteria bacterium CG08_land_8_20_14_0_20_42_7 TaxID=2014245 RepID=A0A2H0YUP7_9BACT|nr:MAG: hypothetical protein COT25_03015 [Candidatus Kerfeldbacteria bacterium CG08_land_8_20_14_0_20_42_7]
MIITINGKPGSGKSSVAMLLSERLNLTYIDIGELRRGAAKERNMTLEEYNQWGETTDETDKDVDSYQKKLGETRDNIVISGRTSFYFIPHSIKILLNVYTHTAAERIFNDKKLSQRNEAKDIASVEAIENALRERLRSDAVRYKKYYDLDVYDPSHYDLVLDTSTISIEETFDKIIEFLQSKGLIEGRS